MTETYIVTKDYYQNVINEFRANGENDNNYLRYYGKPKKFVFVMWKRKENGVPVTDGEDVTNKYRVLYYQPIKKGDTSAYNKASNASFGYAPMLDSKYLIEVYDQDTGKRVKVSDDEIFPHDYFLRNDIWVGWNISYIKIPIRVYD